MSQTFKREIIKNSNNQKNQTKMKNFFNLALLSVITLTGTWMISACSSANDSLAEQSLETNENYDPTTGEVFTKFVFNVATGNTMRQTSADTQASSSETFRGISDAVLFSFKNAVGDGKHIYPTGNTSDPTAGNAGKRYDLQSIMAAGTITSENSHRVIETSLPLNTNSLLFYGKAARKNTDTYETVGHFEEFIIGGESGLDVTGTNIQLSSRISGNQEQFKKIEDLLGGILTLIMNSNLVGNHHDEVEFEGAEVVYPDNIYWSSYANEGGKSPVTPTADLAPLEVKLASVYKEMTNIRSDAGELRGGCSHSLIYTIQAMWSVINEIKFATPFCKEEAVAQQLAVHIHNRLSKYFNGNVPSTGAQVTGVSFFTATSTIKENFNSDTSWPTEAAGLKPSAEYIAGITEDLNKFPEELYKLPAGSAHYTFDRDHKMFKYVEEYNSTAFGGSSFNVTGYCYPAELAYFGNSSIRTSSTQVRPNEYPNGVATWSNDDNWGSSWDGTHVVSTTQAVAMKNNINYGTSLLKTTISYGSTTLEDNNHDIQKLKDNSIADTDEPNKIINVNATSFQLKGIIVGGQTRNAGWDYLPKAAIGSSENPVSYVYDNAIAGTSIPVEGTSAPNYTLLLDNYNAAAVGAGTPQDKVYVSLELVNNTGEDFFGAHGLIRNGGTFYLIGELDPTSKEPSWAASDHPLPPYNADGTTNKIPRVFIQDYMTTVNFTIGANSLKYAYLTVPDLRYSALTLGLSVDLNWETGINFGDVILGK